MKRALADRCAAAGVDVADVAIMAPVPPSGLGTPMLASGPGAHRFAEVVAGLGGSVTVVPVGPGEAARRKLLRSVVIKGLAAGGDGQERG